MCCLGYEDETYSYYKDNFPKIGEMVEVNGIKGRVSELNILAGNYKIKVSDTEEITAEVDLDGSNK